MDWKTENLSDPININTSYKIQPVWDTSLFQIPAVLHIGQNGHKVRENIFTAQNK